MVILGLLSGIYAFTSIRAGGIQGKITPALGVEKVVAIAGKDTLTAEINKGNLVFRKVKPNTYLLLIKGKAPYKDTTIVDVAVIDSATTDIGEIKLHQ